jgi:hypothetical protein
VRLGLVDPLLAAGLDLDLLAGLDGARADLDPGALGRGGRASTWLTARARFASARLGAAGVAMSRCGG